MASRRQPDTAIEAIPPTTFAWLHRPEPLRAGRRRRHLLILALVVAAGFARGAYWATVTPVWSPIDEIAHFGYVQSIAEGHGIPVVGRDLISDQVLRSAKDSPTASYRSQPYRATSRDPNWGPARQQYEATAAPTYYALMALPYRIGRPFGLAAEVLAVRLATVLIGLIAVPLTWALARRLFPRHPPVWLIAPALLVTTNAFAFGAVTNDSLALVMAAAAVLALLRALDDRRAPGWVALAGLVAGLGLVTKATFLTAAPLLLAVIVTWWLSTRPTPARLGRTALVYVGAAAAPVVPWLAWNLVRYHALSGEHQVDRAFGQTGARTALTLSRLWTDIGDVRLGLFSNQLLRAGTSTTAWLVLLALSAVAALALSARRRGWDDVFGVAVCAAALPASFVMLEVVNNAFEQGGGQPVGRHLLAILPFAMIGLAGSLGVVVTRRWLPAAVGLVVTIALFLESRAASDLVQRAYLSAVHDDALAPVVDQTWSDRVVATPSVSVVPSCPVTAFWLGFSGPPPPRLVVRSAGRSWTVPAQPVSSDLPLYDAPTDDTAWYRLPTPLSAPFSIALPPGAAVDASATDRSPLLALAGQPGDPVARLYCRRPGALDLAFARAFDPNHEIRAGRGLLTTLPEAATASAALLTGAATVSALRRRRRPRHRP